MKFNPKSREAHELAFYIRHNPISVMQLAKEIGISYRQLLNILKGYSRTLRVESVMKIERFLNGKRDKSSPEA